MCTPPALHLTLTLYRCRLGKRELGSLFTVASQGYAPGELQFSHERHSRTFTSATLAGLIADVQAAPLPGDPDVWANLTFTATDPAGRRTLTLRLTPDKADLTVTGTDATLVYGTQTQIMLFLTDEAIGGSRHAPHKWYEMRRRLSTVLLPFLIVAWTLVLYFHPLEDPYLQPETAHLWPAALLLICACAVILLLVGLARLGGFLLRERATRGVLEPTQDLLPGSPWQQLSAIEKITAVGVAVAGVAAIGTLVAVADDIVKG
ncbi:hypothetical protein ACIQ7Q_10780 [Streptomyces sp. NPDC096176]|uniref:hypothetical protein n=1 Tax=Streptomyces sp. NPDC096176 TaxID=3366079 RepID=UPI0038023164